MIGIILVTHGNLGAEFIKVLEHVLGPQEKIAAVAISPDDTLESKRQEVLTRMQEVGGDQGVLILTDMFGGTPSNLAISLMAAGKVEVIAGVNVPMLVKLASVRGQKKLAEAAAEAQEAARRYINVASALLAKTPA
jgi:mannose PTS system EIIA component